MKNFKLIIGWLLANTLGFLFLISVWELAGMRHWMCGQ